MKEKVIMTSVLTAGFADVGTTAMGLNMGFVEVGILPSHMIESGLATEAYITRIAVSAVLIGIYALSKQYPHKFTDSVDKGIRIGNIVAWGVAALNAVQLIQHLG